MSLSSARYSVESISQDLVLQNLEDLPACFDKLSLNLSEKKSELAISCNVEDVNHKCWTCTGVSINSFGEH